MAELKDQLRFLCGFPKTIKNKDTGEPEVVVPGSEMINDAAVRAFDALLRNNIKFFSGEIGDMANGAEVLSSDMVMKMYPTRAWCQAELETLWKRHRNILRG